MNRLIVLAVVLAACSGTDAEPSGVGTSDPIEATVPTTVASAESLGSTRAEIEATLAGIGPVTTLDQAKAVIEAVGAGMETDLVPYAYDAARVADAETFRTAMATIGGVIGETPTTDDFRSLSRFYGNWIMNNAPDPGPAYIPWKGALFGNIDPEFEPLIASVEDPVTVARLQWGGVLRGGIPELNDAETIPVAEAGYMRDEEIVFGAVVNGQARAYPVRILGHHELANDTLGGEPVSLVYCTLCRTPVFYHREVAGRVLDFETSGLLENSNKVMVDVQTDSLWNQLTGEAFAGPLKGELLDRLPMVVTTWSDWVFQHPDTDVQRVPTLDLDPDLAGLNPTGGYSYEPGDAYADYYAGSELWFPTFEVPDNFAEKDEVVTIDYRGGRLAVGLDALLDAGALTTSVSGEPVVFVASGNGARVYESVDGLRVVDGRVLFDGEPVTVSEDSLILPDGTELNRLVSGQSFWFAWYGNFPDTDFWPKPGTLRVP
ncbi:MAG: DUF3179 domain-containing protein [Acidimicrobiia bacterium]|nr:DUF3179 domain-containing protein [Acidimicrobiia bacterium]